jgi:nucleoside-diphosphate-sugar epimerase
VAITGASGLVGSALKERLISKGAGDLTCILISPYGIVSMICAV